MSLETLHELFVSRIAFELCMVIVFGVWYLTWSNCVICVIHSNYVNLKWCLWMILNEINVEILWVYVWQCCLSFLDIWPLFQCSCLSVYGLWWCNVNPQWFTTCLSVWTGRWSAGCLVALPWSCRGAGVPRFVQVSRLGLWSRVALACYLSFMTM